MINFDDYIVMIDADAIYRAWRQFLLDNSPARYFGSLQDSTQLADFPGATLRLIGRPTNETDLEGTEVTIDLTVQTDCYTDDNRTETLLEMDTASSAFFIQLGFQRMGDSQIIKQSESVARITSRYIFRNFSGDFLKQLDSFN